METIFALVVAGFQFFFSLGVVFIVLHALGAFKKS
jgi:hypothetical protein